MKKNEKEEERKIEARGLPSNFHTLQLSPNYRCPISLTCVGARGFYSLRDSMKKEKVSYVIRNCRISHFLPSPVIVSLHLFSSSVDSLRCWHLFDSFDFG